MWFLLLLHVAHIQPLISQDAKRLVLRNGSNPCEGYVEVFHKNEWGLVGDKFWNRSTEEVVCRSIHCGEPVESSTVRRPLNRTVWLNELQCKGSESQLWDCDSPGWNISKYFKPTVKKITCSRNITFSLEGNRCAGAVRYSTDGVTPTGYICNEGWSDKEAGDLCGQLGCGGLTKRPTPGQMSGKDFQSQRSEKNMKLDCSGLIGTDNLWQCAAPASTCSYPAAVICSDHERLRLTEPCSGVLQKETNSKWENVSDNNVSPDDRCQQMYCGSARGNVTDSRLTCTDDVSVVLVNNKNEPCYGTVHVQINNDRKAVCGTSWMEKEAKVVCKELGCGTVNSFSKRSTSSGFMDFVECSGSESSLWHCEAKHGVNLKCSDPNAPYVVCSESLEVRLEAGGGRCAGRLEVKHDGDWKRVLKNAAWTDKHSNMVCKQLGCGNQTAPGNPVKYSDGSGSFLTVDCDSNKEENITECIITDTGNNGQSAVGITCEDHKVLFLSGSCSGEVGIKHDDITFWLSDVDWTPDVANTVCQQMHCGTADNFTSTPRADQEVWSHSYNCEHNETSLFECDNTEISSNVSQNASIASVKCSGTIKLKLTKCWGNVNMFMEGKSGGICADTWTEDNSEMLCKEQGCGSKVLKSFNQQSQTEIMVHSLHAMQPNAKLNQYNFIMNDQGRTCQKPASVVCSGSVKPRFSDSIDSCSGKLELSYEEKWLPVCREALKEQKAQNAICRRLNCGVAFGATDDFGPTPLSNQVITAIQCSNNNAASLKECEVTSEFRSCTLGVLKCSKWKTMVLEHEPCKGEVAVYSANEVSAVSSQGWTMNESQRLCQDMACGSPISFGGNGTWPTDSFFNGTFNCKGGKQQSIWDCEKKVPPSEKKKLFIECQNQAQVTLSQKCHGELRINDAQVCSRQFQLDYSNRVCQELSCSNAMEFKEKSKRGVYHHIHCDEYHYKLGQCRRVWGDCNSLVDIVCVGSIKFNTTGKCGGTIRVSYQDKWKEVCSLNELSDKMKNQLCQKMNCGNHNKNFKPRKSETKKNLEMSLVCTEDHLDIRHCVKKQKCTDDPARIFCEDYEPAPSTVEETEPSRVPIILGVSFLLVLLVVVAVGARFYFTRRNRRFNAARMLPGKEMEFESGEYEDVVNRDNEIEDVRGGRFRSDDEFFREDDRRSVSSLPYDDIDEKAEAQPLNPPADTARAGNVQEDKVTYEVEDPLENYDDIESGPEITKAEVHDSPQPTADRDAAAAPPGPAPGDEDYLVPGQDG